MFDIEANDFEVSISTTINILAVNQNKTKQHSNKKRYFIVKFWSRHTFENQQKKFLCKTFSLYLSLGALLRFQNVSLSTVNVSHCHEILFPGSPVTKLPTLSAGDIDILMTAFTQQFFFMYPIFIVQYKCLQVN